LLKILGVAVELVMQCNVARSTREPQGLAVGELTGGLFD
jgi:hypothetical protein